MRKTFRPFDMSARQFGAALKNLTHRTLKLEPAYPGLRQLIREFYDSVLHGTAAPISSEAAIEIAKTRDLLIDAARIQQV